MPVGFASGTKSLDRCEAIGAFAIREDLPNAPDDCLARGIFLVLLMMWLAADASGYIDQSLRGK
jgi:hypothetical protein